MIRGIRKVRRDVNSDVYRRERRCVGYNTKEHLHPRHRPYQGTLESVLFPPLSHEIRSGMVAIEVRSPRFYGTTGCVGIALTIPRSESLWALYKTVIEAVRHRLDDPDQIDLETIDGEEVPRAHGRLISSLFKNKFPTVLVLQLA